MRGTAGLKPNHYIIQQARSDFLSLIGEMASDDHPLKTKDIFDVAINHFGEWPEQLNLFQYIKKSWLRKIRQRKCYLIFDASYEGYSQYQHPLFKILYTNCRAYKINPDMIIYLSSNLKDDEYIQAFSEKHNILPLRVFCYPALERWAIEIGRGSLKDHMENCEKNHSDKLFSSLSRVNRDHRSLATFMLCQSSVVNRALVSHSKLSHGGEFHTDKVLELGYSKKQCKRWQKSLPLVIDRQDFETNWAFDSGKIIADRTIFQIVNETEVNYSETALFYSEKTFKPIRNFQPFVIYGQLGANNHLRKLGYETYHSWFDIDYFDWEPDPIERYRKLLDVIEHTVGVLESMSREERIAWRFKDQALLEQNERVLSTRSYTKNKLKEFLSSF